MRRRKGREVHRLHLVEPPLRIKQADCVSRDQSTERVTNDAQCRDRLPALVQSLDRLFDLMCKSLSPCLDPIIGVIAAICFGAEYMQPIFSVSLFQRGGDKI